MLTQYDLGRLEKSLALINKKIPDWWKTTVGLERGQWPFFTINDFWTSLVIDPDSGYGTSGEYIFNWHSGETEFYNWWHDKAHELKELAQMNTNISPLTLSDNDRFVLSVALLCGYFPNWNENVVAYEDTSDGWPLGEIFADLEDLRETLGIEDEVLKTKYAFHDLHDSWLDLAAQITADNELAQNNSDYMEDALAGVEGVTLRSTYEPPAQFAFNNCTVHIFNTYGSQEDL